MALVLSLLVPVLNVSLAIKAIVVDTARLEHLMIAYASLIGIALVGVALCSLMFNREGAAFRT
ncbi:TPA: hypothetical protein DCE37_13200 [Candidatus Latescibacteria bacterium]|nr:hypothetical protein [Candidatus Latescibacterota bacterium]|tara:strand:+ start:545 stop:733 length:189 start_codon:yes stop_codon:yes gene_type:complete